MIVCPLKPLRYTLMRTECEICHSNELKVFTRKRYLLVACLYLALSLLFFYVRYLSAAWDNYLRLSLNALAVTWAIAFVRCVLLAVIRQEPTYKCKSCG